MLVGAKTKHYFKTGKEFKGNVHKMPNGQIIQAKHSKTSKQVVHFKDLSAKTKKVARADEETKRKIFLLNKDGKVSSRCSYGQMLKNRTEKIGWIIKNYKT